MKSCHDYAVEYISRYPKTEKELRIKLYQKWYDSEDVDRTIEVLKKKKFVDDHLFAEMYVRSDVVKKGKPSLALRKKLEMKGVDVATLNDVFNENQVEMQEGIDTKIRKDIEQYKSKWVEWFDIIQKLLRKWYKLGDIKKVITSIKT